jgi:hypothetical protein
MSTFSTPELLLPDEADLAGFAALFEESSLIGATAGGGLHRLAASEEDGRVRDLFCNWLKERGFDVRVDAVGNIFGLLTFDEHAPYVLCGSHLDSQPSAGRFDGVYGVLAAAVAIASLARQIRQRGERPACNLCVVNWTNEEGARFQPSLTGSSVYTPAGTNEAFRCRRLSRRSAIAVTGCPTSVSRRMWKRTSNRARGSRAASLRSAWCARPGPRSNGGCVSTANRTIRVRLPWRSGATRCWPRHTRS